jgi:hypothetical protein
MSRNSAATLVRLVISLTTMVGILFACTPKKASTNYGDNKVYLDEDSIGEVKTREKKTKMPFDTTALPVVPKK